MSKESLPVQPVTVHPDIISMSGMCAKEASTCLTIALMEKRCSDSNIKVEFSLDFFHVNIKFC